MEPKYICYSGRIYHYTRRTVIHSGMLGDEFPLEVPYDYVAAHQVALLHGLKPHRCVLVEEGQEDKLRGLRLEEYIVLRPNVSGKYPLIGHPTRPDKEGVVFHDS